MRPIKPEYIGTILRYDGEEFSFDPGRYELHIGSPEALRSYVEDLVELYEEEPPVQISDKLAALQIKATHPEIIYEVGEDTYLDPTAARELLAETYTHQSKALAKTIKRLLKTASKQSPWPKKFGGQNLKATVGKILDWLQSGSTQNDIESAARAAELHELAHLAFYQTYPKFTEICDEIGAKIENRWGITSEEADNYLMYETLSETNAILTEEDPWIFHHRIAQLLLGLKTMTGRIEDCENYYYVRSLFPPHTQEAYESGAYFYASCLITFGAQMLDYNPETNTLRFNPKFMFETTSWEEGQQPTHEQIIRFLQKWEAAQMEMLEAGFDAYVQRLPAIRQELTAIAQPYLEKSEAQLEKLEQENLKEQSIAPNI